MGIKKTAKSNFDNTTAYGSWHVQTSCLAAWVLVTLVHSTDFILPLPTPDSSKLSAFGCSGYKAKAKNRSRSDVVVPGGPLLGLTAVSGSREGNFR